MKVSFEKERLTVFSSSRIPMGFIAFPQVRPGLVNITQVRVSPQFRGQGVEDAMMEALLNHLSRQDQKAALSSPFAQQYVGNHPEWKNILPGDIHFTRH